MRSLRFCLVIALALLNADCSVNILKTFANTQTDDALYYDAQASMDALNFNGALTYISQMSTTFQAQDKVLRIKASAFGGLCGWQFVPYASNFANIGATLLFPFLEGQLAGATAAQLDDCINAQNTIMAIPDPSLDDYTFLAVAALAKIGVILSYYDGNATTTVNTGFDACSNDGGAAGHGTAGGQITDSDAEEIGTGISVAANAFAQIAGQVNMGSGAAASITNLCNTLSGLPGAPDFCGIQTDAGMAPYLKAIRTVVKENQFIGLGITQLNGSSGPCPGSVSQCYCP